MSIIRCPIILGAAILAAAGAMADDLAVISVTPQARTNTATIHTAITVEFDQPVDRNTVDGGSFGAFGRWSGPVDGSYAFSNGDTIVTLTPSRPLSSGEPVMVMLSHDLLAVDGDPMRSGGYSFQFMTTAGAATKTFTLSQDFSTRSGQNTRSYGGVATDLNNDGWLDLTITNEDTSDVRVFMNSADGQGTFNDFLEPPQGVGLVPSPSEPADFNGDGLTDLCIANTVGDSVSILLGAGDGTWTSHQEVAVGGRARGIAVLDVDGDGDADIVNTNADSGNLSMLINNGAGVFGGPTFFDGGVTEEWALAAADMNEDGMLDLITGGRSGQQIGILTANGDGTFSVESTRASGGRTWMINCGDVNGDGHEDVICANSSQNHGSVLFGDGAGNLGPATTYPTDSFPLATDIGDLDGDGDLDWVTSSFSGDWFIFENDGSGNFTFVEEIDAPSAASCALILDFDNDRDLDLAMVDEIADRLITYKNDGTRQAADLDTLSIVTGTILEGDASSVETSDNQRLRTRSGFGSTFVDLHHMEMLLSATTAVGDAGTLSVTIESRIDQPAGLAQVRLRNWTSGTFDFVGGYAIGAAEEVITIDGIAADAYVDGSGAIELSIKHIVFAPLFAFTFESELDWIEIGVSE